MASQSKRIKLLSLVKRYRVASDFHQRAVTEYLTALDCPRSLAVYMLWKYSEHEQLVGLSCNASDYATPWAFRDAYAATQLLSKAEFLSLDRNRDDVAYEKFFLFESFCQRTNYRFRDLARDPLYVGPNVWLLHAVERKVASILGDFSADEMLDYANWGPGVTNAIKGQGATNVNKFQFETGITRDLYSLWCRPEIAYAYPLWQEHLALTAGFPTFEVGSVTVTVPKDAKTNRVISVEPGFNLFFQKGVGQMIRRRLRSKGVDLDDQTRNQKLASVAVKRDLATVDFSSASDSVSLELVRAVIPPDWLEWLEALRSHFGRVKDKPMKWEKFSSMGNGFTFELESLIFYSAALAVAEYLGVDNSDVSVYGDDVIIPSSCYELFSSFSTFLGFHVNPEKSFASGQFRESCGSHWCEGVDVKPIFVKEMITTLEKVFKFGNAIREQAHRYLNSIGCDSRFRRAFRFCLNSVPRTIRFRIPHGYGDGGFISNLDETCPQVVRRHPAFEGYLTSHLRSSPVKGESDGVGLLMVRLRSSSTQESNTWIPRGRTCLLSLVNGGKLKVQQWTMLAEPVVKNSDPEGFIKRRGSPSNKFPLRGITFQTTGRLYVNQWYDLGPWF